MAIWETHNIPLDKYAKHFNKTLAEAFNRQCKNKMYFIAEKDGNQVVHRIINLKVPE